MSQTFTYFLIHLTIRTQTNRTGITGHTNMATRVRFALSTWRKNVICDNAKISSKNDKLERSIATNSWRRALARNVEKFFLSYRLPRLKTFPVCYPIRGLRWTVCLKIFAKLVKVNQGTRYCILLFFRNKTRLERILKFALKTYHWHGFVLFYDTPLSLLQELLWLLVLSADHDQTYCT